jgi:hypothetical protein
MSPPVINNPTNKYQLLAVNPVGCKGHLKLKRSAQPPLAWQRSSALGLRYQQRRFTSPVE